MLPPEIISKIPSSYEKGLESGDIFYFPSSTHTHSESGIDFEVRLCPALQKKPHLPTPHFDGTIEPAKVEPTKSDPFSPPYVPGLFVGYLRSEEASEEYVVLMNKYCIVPRHFLLVTKEFQSQTSPLMPDDLLQAYSLLGAARRQGKTMFAFYNCGDLSGASQPHKHLQLIEVDDFEGPPVERYAKTIHLESPGKPFAINALPYANHVFRFPPNLFSSPIDKREMILADAFLSLLDLVISTVRHDPDYPPGMPSYNVILTLEHLHLIPRRLENHTLAVTGEQLSVNSLGFAGMLLVKSERELEAVKAEGIGNILRSVALESVHDIQVAGTTRDADGDASHML